MRQRITREDSGLDHKEWEVLKRLNTPAKIQDFVNALPFDFRAGDKIDRSVRGILKSGKADCAGGAIVAAAALWLQGRRPLVIDLHAPAPDFDHVVAIFREGRYFGAISKTNHAVLRYRDPIYTSIRELAMSYFHEYFLLDGSKSLRDYSKPFDLSKYGAAWCVDGDRVADLIHDLDRSPHTKILSASQTKLLRRADPIERKAANIKEYP